MLRSPFEPSTSRKKGRKGPESWKLQGAARLAWEVYDFDTRYVNPYIKDQEEAHKKAKRSLSMFGHDILGVGNAKSLFGTASAFWNALLGLMAQLPPLLLANEELMSRLAIFSLPIVRLVDYFAGATNAMRCDVSSSIIPGMRAR